ncbi:MAG: ribosome small subunit-dependent GTPase A [Spirochaetales bacterium]|nr:ribosome small subunit-dependent GTPase A [Spirochaetales bacterium]
MNTGLVLTGRNNIFTVLVDDRVLLCRLKGKRLNIDERSYNPLAPGDLVTVGSVDYAHESGIIEGRLERSNAFVRFNRKRMAPQMLAANVDEALCIASVREPGFRPRFVDRFLALAEDQGIAAAVIVNKADLDADQANRVVDRYRGLGYPAFALSASRGDGAEDFRRHIASRLVVFVGQSGVGKSTLLNGLVGREMQQVGHVSHKFRRGRHTTNAARLVQDSGLRIVDTPGIRELDIRTIEIGALGWCFREFRDFIGSCEHSDCVHRDEPSCAVRTAAAEGEISSERYESYLRLLTELRDLENESS